MLVLLLILAFRSGVDRYYLLTAQGNRVGAKDVFFYLRGKRIFTVALFYFNYFLRKLFVFLFCFSPVVISMLLLLYYIEKGGASLAVSVTALFVTVLFFLNSLVFFVRFNSLFFVARYCFASGNFSSYRQLFSFSYKCIDGKRRKVFLKKISFIPLFMCCIFLIPITFVRNLYAGTMAELAKDLMNNSIYKKEEI